MLLRFLSVAVVSTAALAADPESVKPPYVEVGDCWSYRATKLFNRGWISEYRECITHIDRAKDILLALATIRHDNREIETSYSLEWAESTPIDGRYSTPPARYLRFPLRVGDTYTASFESINTQFGSFRFQANLEMKVLGWEDVSVPAGKFRALRIEGKGQVPGLRTAQLTWARKIWYAPEVNRAVKWSFANYGGGTMQLDDFEIELTAYELNK